MAENLEYSFTLKDEISAKLGNITITSTKMLDKFAALQTKTADVTRVFNETGRTLGSLRSKIDLLRAEREWLPAENIEGIRAYNREIKKLNKEVDKLESLNGGKFAKWSKQAFAAIPGSDLISNPLVATGAALAFAGQSAMNFDEGMAKVNITAQLDGEGLAKLKQQIKQVAVDNKTEIAIAPVGFEKIISQVGDVDTSLQILDASLKGSKGGFTDLDTVSGALAQTLSIVGKENTNAKEVLDTFFAAKRVGAGEFADFARYMPNLIAGASNLGINFKEVAGTFAYMTGKGQSAERAAVLMENAFSVLGKSDIRGKMEKAGVKVFDEQGKIRGVVDIFKDLQGVLGSLNDEQKSSILEGFGITDKEAKGAFAIMTADIAKLQESMGATANASGETDKALEYSRNAMQKVQESWAQFKNMGLTVGELMLPMVGAGLDVVTGALWVVQSILEPVLLCFTFLFDQIQRGTPLGWGLVAALGALGVVMGVNYALRQKSIVLEKTQAIWTGILAVKNAILTGSIWAMTAALLANPLFWIPAVIGAVVAAITLCWQKFEGFRKVVMGVWEVIKALGKALWEGIVGSFQKILSGFGALGKAIAKLVKGDFSGAWDSAKDGMKDLASGVAGMSPVGMVVNAVAGTDFKGAWEKGKQRGSDSWKKSQEKKEKVDNTEIPGSTIPVPGNTDFDALMGKLNAGKDKVGGKAGSKIIDFGERTQSVSASGNYSAIVSQLSPKMVSLAPSQTPTSKMEGIKTSMDESVPSMAAGKAVINEKVDWLADIGENVRKIAAVLAVPIAMSLSSQPTNEGTAMGTMPEQKSVSVQMDRFCDQIVIHVKDGSREGVEEFASQLDQRIREVLEQIFGVV